MPTIRGPVVVRWRGGATPRLMLQIPGNVRADLILRLPMPGMAVARVQGPGAVRVLEIEGEVLSCDDLGPGRHVVDVASSGGAS